MKLSKTDIQIYIGGAGLLLGAYTLWKTSETAKAAINAVNPLNSNNIANKGANAVVGFDNKTESIGTWLHRLVNPEYDKTGVMPSSTKKETVLKVPVTPKVTAKTAAPKNTEKKPKTAYELQLERQRAEADRLYWELVGSHEARPVKVTGGYVHG